MAGTALKIAAPYLLGEVLAGVGLGAAAASHGGRNTSNETSGLPQGGGANRIYNLQPAPSGGEPGGQPSSSSSPPASVASARRRAHYAWDPVPDGEILEFDADNEFANVVDSYDLAFESKLSAVELADLSLAAERMSARIGNALADQPELDSFWEEGQQFLTAQEQAPVSRIQLARRMLLAGVSFDRFRAISQAITRRYGNTQAARAIASRWVLKRINKYKKAVAAAAGGVVLGAVGNAVSSNAAAVYREGKGDIVGVDEEIDEAAADVDVEAGRDLSVRAPHGNPWWVSPIKPLPGSVAGTADPGKPLGPIDSVIPRSSPSIPSSGPIISTLPSGGTIFTDGLSGDSLSEKPSMPGANVLRTSIPTPPALNFIAPSESYQPIDYSLHPGRPEYNPPTPHQNLKRKAAEYTTHKERGTESQITQNYDPAMVPGLPSSVTADTSLQWKEYTPPFKGYNVPLDDAPNIVGIGFDAQENERQRAMQAPTSGKEAVPHETKTVQPAAPVVNAANATNPSLRNYGKENVPPPQIAPPQPSPNRP